MRMLILFFSILLIFLQGNINAYAQTSGTSSTSSSGVTIQGIDRLVDTISEYAKGKVGNAVAFVAFIVGAIAAVGGRWGTMITALVIAALLGFAPSIIENLWSAR